jgi:hypothetical protein
MKSRIRWFMLFIFMTSVCVYGQFDDRGLVQSPPAMKLKTESYFTKATHLIDLPTASILRGGDIRTSFRFFEHGGMLGRLSVGISNRMMFGVSYGGLNMIGLDHPSWNKVPGVHFVYRIIEESLGLPAFVIGFDSQGYGKYWEQAPANSNQDQLSDRYSIKSRGFYLCFSKGYTSILKSGLHAGASYSLEDGDGDSDPTVFLGMDAAISRDIGLIFEYDFGINDDEVRGKNNGKGYLSAGFRWAVADFIFLEFDYQDILAEKVNQLGPRRIMKIIFHGSVR